MGQPKIKYWEMDEHEVKNVHTLCAYGQNRSNFSSSCSQFEEYFQVIGRVNSIFVDGCTSPLSPSYLRHWLVGKGCEDCASVELIHKRLPFPLSPHAPHAPKDASYSNLDSPGTCLRHFPRLDKLYIRCSDNGCTFESGGFEKWISALDSSPEGEPIQRVSRCRVCSKQ